MIFDYATPRNKLEQRMYKTLSLCILHKSLNKRGENISLTNKDRSSSGRNFWEEDTRWEPLESDILFYDTFHPFYMRFPHSLAHGKYFQQK